MPTAKGKGIVASQRYRPAAQYDDATLAQKREYWRNKKREQRARLSERRGRATRDSRGKKLLHLSAPEVVNSSLSSSGSFSSPCTDESYKTVNVSSASQGGNTVQSGPAETTESQKERWLQTMNLNKVLPHSPASCSISAKASVKCLKDRGALSESVTSPTPSGTQLNTSSSVPQVRVTRISNGSSANTAPQPRVSMQGASVPKTQHKAQVALRIQPKLLPTDVTTGMILVSSPRVPVPLKTKGNAASTPPQSGTKSALVTLQRAKSVSNSRPSLESDEERAAKRREQWRIKKREQRAKVAAQIAKARERMQGAEVTLQRQTVQKTGRVGATIVQQLPSHSFLRGVGQKERQVKTSFTSAKGENDKLQSEVQCLAPANLQEHQIKVENTQGTRTTQSVITSDVIPVKRLGDSQRKFPSYVHLPHVSRGIARCKTPRQRFIEAHKSFMSQRNIRCKSPLLSSVFGTRNMPKIDPNDTPEQIIAKRREYWRIKKREQRAKLTMEMKDRLKEKDSLMRRVKRYQMILEEMRRARALTQSAGSSLTHASETIGGFIKEDGTVTINIPQIPIDHNTAAHTSEEEIHVVSNNPSISKAQHQPDTKQRNVAPVRVSPPPPPPLHPAQVKVSLPHLGQSVSKPPRLLSIRPRTQLGSTTVPNSHSLEIQTVGQLTLTQPHTSQKAVSGGSTAGSNLGSCVMKMAVSSSVPSVLSLDPELTEEERMAKKREYWRIKKREQRAARAARLKLGVLQARANVTLQRRRAQRQASVSTVSLDRRLTNHTGNTQPLPNSIVPVTPHASEIKQESEPAVDLNSQPDQAICPDLKPPTSPTPPPAPQPEPDPALNADSQATTLLAVASMKKLLEESLSTVTECRSIESDVKVESAEETSEAEMKPDLPQLFFEKDEVSPLTADLTLEIKGWQSDADALVQAGSPSPHLEDSPQTRETLTPSEVALHPTCEHSSQTPSNFIVTHTEASYSPPSPPKADHQNGCSPEPPKLYHLPMDQLQPQQQHCDPQCQAQEESQNSNSPSEQRCLKRGMMEHSGLNSLQRKREYWKLMKRQQRARMKARQKNIQAPGVAIMNAVKGTNPPAKQSVRPKSSVASLTAVTSIPMVLVVSPTSCNAEQSPDTLQVKLPITSCSPTSEPDNMNNGPSQTESDHLGDPENLQQAILGPRKWSSGSTDLDSAPCLPTLKPPDNPLSSINLQPIEPPALSPDSSLSPIKIPCVQRQSPVHMIHSPTKLVPVSTMVPPKPIPGEPEEDFLRRKREYWRIKKKEQRARKATRDKGVSPRRTSNNWRPILPAQDLQIQDCGQWASSSEESEHLMSMSGDTEPGSFSYPNYTAPVEDEAELLFPYYENNNVEEGLISDTVWRNRYLMDYDPLNQLLVCMVCGELQYSHSLEGVRAHIDEAHPDTLNMDPGEQQRILEAWDEQVSQRERFFTSQLQQHSGALTEAQDREAVD